MSKADIIAMGVSEGLNMAIRIAKEARGRDEDIVAALERNYRFRNARGIRPALSDTEIMKATEQMHEYNTELETGITLFTLWQDFDMDSEELQRFLEERDANTKAMNEGSIDWADVLEELTKRGIEFEFDDALILESQERKKKWEETSA